MGEWQDLVKRKIAELKAKGKPVSLKVALKAAKAEYRSKGSTKSKKSRKSKKSKSRKSTRKGNRRKGKPRGARLAYDALKKRSKKCNGNC